MCAEGGWQLAVVGGGVVEANGFHATRKAAILRSRRTWVKNCFGYRGQHVEKNGKTQGQDRPFQTLLHLLQMLLALVIGKAEPLV